MRFGPRTITDPETARQILADGTFIPIDLSANLRKLQAASGVDLQRLAERARDIPFFMNGAAHRDAKRHIIAKLGLADSTAWRSKVRDICQRNAAGLAARSDFCLVEDYCRPVIGQTVATLLFNGQAGESAENSWMTDLQPLIEATPRCKDLERAQTALQEMAGHLCGLREQGSLNSSGTILEAFWRDTSLEHRREEILTWCATLYFASAATMHTLCNVLGLVLTRGDRLGQYSDRDRRQRSVPELLRTGAAIEYTLRVATTARTIGEAGFVAGEILRIKVRDAQLADGRDLTFGHGAHFCPGSSLAALLLDESLHALALAVPDAELSGDVPRYQRPPINSVASLPCRISAVED